MRARVERLQRDLVAARVAGDQTAAVDALRELAGLEPGNPVHHLLLGETLASLGPEFRPELAAEALARFLAATGAPGPDGAAVAEPAVLEALARSGGVRPEDGLRGLRRGAERLLGELQKRNPEKQLLSPDRATLAWRVRRLERDQVRLRAEQARTAKSVATAKERLAAARKSYEEARARGRSRVLSDTTELWTRVQDRREALTNLERRAARIKDQLAAAAAEHGRLRTRLAAFAIRGPRDPQ